MTTAPKPDTMLRSALMYAEVLEWPVVPLHTPMADAPGGCSCRDRECVSAGKHPRTLNGLKDATTDPEKVRHWWETWPDANIGIPTGAESELIVVDVDGPAGEEALATYAPIPATPTVLTGKGRHLYFRHPGNGQVIRNTGGKGRRKLGELLDSRGDGGYVVVPPSLHASGNRYAWDKANGLGPRDLQPQVLPASILARITAEDAGGTPAPGTDDSLTAADIPGLPAIENGTRNETLTAYAGRLLRQGLPASEATELVWAVNQSKCTPPLTRPEIAAIVRNIAKAEGHKIATNTRRAEVALAQSERPALPDARTLAQQQIDRALAIGDEDWSSAPRFPWRDVDALVGPILPGELVLVGARPGNGKTTLLLNWCDYLVEQGTPWLYIGMEMGAEQLRRQWAAWRTGLDAELVLGNQWSRLRPGAKEDIAAELRWQATSDIAGLAHFAPARSIGLLDLKEWTEWAVKEGCEVLVVDHFHRMNHGGGDGEERRAMGDTVRGGKELAVKHGIRLVVAAQLNRGSSDELAPYYPPPLTALRECGALEEEADTVLMLHRALREGLDKKDLALVKEGLSAVSTVAAANTMGVMLRKFRKNGNRVDTSARLRVEQGRISDRDAPGYYIPQSGIEHRYAI